MTAQNATREKTFLKLFQEVTRWITSTLDLDEVLSLIARKVPEAVGVDAATIRLLDADGSKLTLLAAHGLSLTYLNRGPVDTEKSVRSALAGTPVVIADAATDPRNDYCQAAEKEGIESILVAPIPIRGSIRGVLRLLTREPRDYGREEIEFVTAIAEQCGIAIENARAYEHRNRQYRKIRDLVTELEQQEHFLQQVIDNLHADLFVLDTRGRFVMVNRVFLENHGQKESDVLGRPCHRMLRVGETDADWIRQALKKNRALSFTRQIETEGDSVHLEVTLSPVSAFSAGGPSDFIIGTIRDVTDHVRLLEEHRLRERLQGVLEMAGAVAHELNTPLFSALGTAQLLAEDATAESPSGGDIETIVRSLETVAELTRKMTRITRYASKVYVDDVKIVDIEKASR